MPSVAIAGSDGLDAVGAVVDGERQGVGTRTIISVGVVVSIGASSGIFGAVPCVVVAGGFGVAIVGARVNGQIERVHIGAARARLRVVVCVNTRSSVCSSIPYVLVAGGDSISGVVMDADVEVQRVGARTSVGVGVLVGVYACGSIFSLMPRVAVAGSGSLAVVGRGIKGQMEGDGAVTTL